MCHKNRIIVSAMAQQVQGQCGYRTFRLLKSKPLGNGSYGAVYKAMCDELPCAGKLLHPTLLRSNDPGATTVMVWFQQECKFLSAIRHPNIVQYLGLHQDPETQQPVLLMELMFNTIPGAFSRATSPIPYPGQCLPWHSPSSFLPPLKWHHTSRPV